MTEEDIAKQRKTSLFGKKVIILETIGSTNSYAASILQRNVEEGTVILAEQQTGGRGRAGRSWSSEKGKNLTFSVILKPDIPAPSIGVISLYAALSVAEAVRDTAGLDADCKWPNDVLVGGRKLCGILSETSFQRGKPGAVILGIGLNVNQTHFPPEIQAPPTSLRLAAARTFDRASVLASVLGRLEVRYAELQSRQFARIIAAWKEVSATIGKEIRIEAEGEILQGIARDIADDGGLIVRVNGADRKILAGDISILSS